MSILQPILYCPQCGKETIEEIPSGEDRKRSVCPACSIIHYQNPRMVVCTLATTENGKLLLARRNITPRFDKWTLPGGFLELGESVSQCALREFEEETCCKVEVMQPFSIISIPHAAQVHLFYCARLLYFDASPTPESSEVSLFESAQIPWGDIAFRSVYYSLKHYYQQGASERTFLLASINREGLLADE